jgi:predicted ribosome quality control (RQC) complex YloA/Tae2 family protein
LLRSHQFEADVALKVGELYPLKFSTNIADTGPAATDDVGIQCGNVGQFLAWATQRNEMQDLWQQSQHAAGAKGGKTKKMNLRQLLLSKDSTVSHFGPEILDHIVLSCPGLSPSTKVSSFLSSCEADAVGAAALLQGLRGAEALLKDLDQPYQPGYIIAKSAEPGAELLEFTSALLKQHEGQASKIFATYGDAVDEYFFKLEDAKIRKLQNAAEEAALKKLQKVKSEAENHAKKLVQTQESMQRAAQVVVAHAEEIDKCTLVLNSCLESGMAWQDIEAMVALEARQGNPIATLIKRLRLDKNRVVLELPAPREEDEDDEADPEAEAEEDRFEDDGGAAGGSRLRSARISGVPGIDVEINLALSAHANARTLFSHKKAVSQKHAQTIESSSRAVAAVEQSTHKTIEAQKQKKTLKEARKVHWFERFHWFVSSDGQGANPTVYSDEAWFNTTTTRGGKIIGFGN